MTFRSFALLVFTDGRRDCFERTMRSAEEQLGFEHFAHRLIIDDSADTHYWRVVQRVADKHSFNVVAHLRRRGFGGTIADGWSRIEPATTHIFHLEDDFVFNQPVEIDAMADVLDANMHLAQLVLLRQPWNEEERAAGGIMQAHPDDFSEVDGLDYKWVEHRRFFSTNPSLYRAELTRGHSWPDVARSEGVLTARLLAERPETRFAFWGGLDDAPAVTHIGAVRVGSGY